MPKRLFKIVYAMILTFLTLIVPLHAKPITLTFNGQVLNPTVAPIVVNGTTYIPLRIVADNLGAQTNYIKTDKNEYIEIVKSGTTIKLAVKGENGYPQIDGKTVNINVSPKIVNGTTMVPVRFVSENLGCKVNYWSGTNTVAITTDGQITGITVKLDGKEVKLEQPAFVQNEKVYVPATIVKEIGATPSTPSGTLRLTRKDIVVSISVGNKNILVNWTNVPYNTPLKRIKGIDFISEEVLRYMNCDTSYDVATKTLEITNKGPIKAELSKERYVDLTGRVLYPDGTPAKNVQVDFSPTDASGADWGYSYYGRRSLKPIEPVYTDENGYFVFKNFDTETFPFGGVSVGIDPSGYTPVGEWRGGTGIEVDPELLYNTKRAGILMPGLNLKRGDLGTIYLFPFEGF